MAPLSGDAFGGSCPALNDTSRTTSATTPMTRETRATDDFTLIAPEQSAFEGYAGKRGFYTALGGPKVKEILNFAVVVLPGVIPVTIL
jgi:hypothetical protein